MSRSPRAALTAARSSALSKFLKYLAAGCNAGDIRLQVSCTPRRCDTALDNVVALSVFGVVANTSVGAVLHLCAWLAGCAPD